MQAKLKFRSFLHSLSEYGLSLLKWLGLGLLVGAFCGLLGAAFSHSVSGVTALRDTYPWLLYLLPAGGLLSVLIYKLCKTTGIGTNRVFEGVRNEKEVPVLLAPAVFAGSVITHLFGGSAGREGAALQLGAAISTFISKVFKLKDNTRHILTICGMAAFFSALFGTPVGALVFAVEVVSVGKLYIAAFFPGIIASVTSFSVATLLNVHPERFSLKALPELNLSVTWRVIVIAVTAALVSVVFCKLMHLSHHIFEKLFKNDFLRIAVSGLLIIGLTFIVGSTDYNGGGLHVVNRIFESGSLNYEAFALKLLFTVITIGAGFKGGEIVPTLFIGATLGGGAALILGLDPTFGAAIGMSALFCGVTNCPLATIILSVELFGGQGITFIALATIISYFLSGYTGLYTGQKILFSKTAEADLNRNAG